MTPSEKITSVLNYLKINPKTFSEALGYQRPQIIYDLQKNKTKRISEDLANKIVSVYPEFRLSWLLANEGTMLRDRETESAPAAKPAERTPAENPDTVAGMIELQKGYQQMLAKSQEQIDRLISIIEDMRKS